MADPRPAPHDVSGDIRKGQLRDFGLLYVSKSGSILVGLLILPLFNRVLGPEVFGWVALIFSIQAFLLLLDFGMSTVVGRNLAIVDSTPLLRYTTWRAAGLAISFIYIVASPLVLTAAWLSSGPLDSLGAIGCLVLFWALTLQNIGQSALLARQRFLEASAIQMMGVLARNGLAAAAMIWIAPTLKCFIATQAVVAVAQMLVTRWYCIQTLRPSHSPPTRTAIRVQIGELLRLGKPLMLFGLAGAAVMQLDKVIVSGVMSARELAPYFLAASFCMIPLSVLAAPVAQFFQPRLIRTLSAREPTATKRVLAEFVLGIAACALLPTGVIWVLRDPLIALWLDQSADTSIVALYSGILLPGIAIGAIGYVPYIMLVSQQDYRFQARFSTVLTLVTLGAVFFFASSKSITAICVVYSIYHTVSTIGSWVRCVQLDVGGGGVTMAGARYAIAATLLVSGVAICAGGFVTNFVR